MVIEHAERFGLAQLHQLRGRIGRGAGHSTCLLLYKTPLGETAKARLAIMRETEDGFRIAEEDLRLRGEGDLLGTRQSGDAGLPRRAARIARQISRRRARRRRADPGARSRARDARAARRCARCSICSRRTRRSASSAPAEAYAPPSGSGPKRFGPVVPFCTKKMISTMMPMSGIKAISSHQPLRSMSCSRRTPTARRRQQARPELTMAYRPTGLPKMTTVEDVCDDENDEVKQRPPPIGGALRAAGKVDVIAEIRTGWPRQSS